VRLQSASHSAGCKDGCHTRNRNGDNRPATSSCLATPPFTHNTPFFLPTRHTPLAHAHNPSIVRTCRSLMLLDHSVFSRRPSARTYVHRVLGGDEQFLVGAATKMTRRAAGLEGGCTGRCASSATCIAYLYIGRSEMILPRLGDWDFPLVYSTLCIVAPWPQACPMPEVPPTKKATALGDFGKKDALNFRA
jgi:hypothetical protein